MLTFARDEDAAQLWDVIGGQPMPRDLADALADPAEALWWHNAAFDRAVLRRCLKLNLPISRFRCTMAQALSHGLPGSLGTLGQILGIAEDEKKRVDDARLIDLFCVPYPDGTYADRRSNPEEWDRFCQYGLMDTVALRAIHKKLPTVNYTGVNLETWHVDQLIVERGFGFDTTLATAARGMLAKAKDLSDAEVLDRTAGAVKAATQRAKLLAYFQSKGLDIPNMRAATIREWLDQDGLSPELRFLLELRLDAAQSSGSKYRTGLERVGAGDRVRYALQFNGAGRTGRTSGRGFQPQNLPRVTASQSYIENIIVPGILSGDALSEPLIYGTPNEACKNAIRASIIPAPGNELVIADLSNIEGRILAWLADEEWKLEGYRAADRGEGADGYRILYARFFGGSVDDVTDDQRQVGKVVDLSCLAADTQVLTNRGYVDIVQVSDTDLLWDGAEWVRHAGLVAKGVRPVVNVDGIYLTPDHSVLVTRQWLPAQNISSNASTLCQALATGSANLPWSKKSPPGAGTDTSQSSALAESNTISTGVTCGAAYLPDAADARDGKRPILDLSVITALDVYRKPSSRIDAAFWPGWLRRSVGATNRRTRTSTTTVRAAFASQAHGERTEARSSRMSSRFRAGITRCLKWIVRKWTGTTKKETFASSHDRKISETAARCLCSSGGSLNSKPVYDIAFAGPRNRFTVKTNTGHLIVHNCGYLAGVGAFVTMAAGYQIDLDTLPALVLPNANEEHLKKAWKAWSRAFLDGEDFDLNPETYVACDVLKQVYREANKKIFDTGHAVGQACLEALENPGSCHEVARCRIWRAGTFLAIQLPSGRRLLYADPRIAVESSVDLVTGRTSTRKYITYLTARGKGWIREKAWAGLFIENIVQAVANCILRTGKRLVHAETWAIPEIRAYLETVEGAETAISMDVHDEIVCDVPVGSYAAKRLVRTMTQGVLDACPWVRNLPLAAKGHTARRYGK